jgi:hypothetical protein
VGTIVSRLARARERLRGRLTRRGLAPLPALPALPALPPALVGPTLRAATRYVAPTAAGTVPAHAAALAREVTTAMSIRKPKVAASVVALSVLVGVTLAVAGQAPPEKEPGPPRPDAAAVAFRRIDPTVRDLLEVTGLNVFKFRLEMKKGERFRLMLQEFPARGQGPRHLHHFDYAVDQEAPELRVSFLRRDGKLGGVLLSPDKEAEYRVSCPGCKPPGIGTIVPNPLHAVEGQKTQIVLGGDKDRESAAGPDGRRLLVVYKNDPEAKTFGMNLGTVYPRAELVVIKLGKDD